jgi:DNA-binding transcriptional regulator YiaG
MTPLLEPTPDNLRQLREETHLSQKAVALLIHLSAFNRVSDWERERHPIDPARWELLLIKTGRHPDFKPRKRKTSPPPDASDEG